MKRAADESLESRIKRLTEPHERSDNQTEGVFRLRPISRFDKNFPFLRQPKEVGSFSQIYEDRQRKFTHDRSQLKYFVPPKNSGNVNYNLRDGYESFIERDDSKKEHLDDLLRWIQLNREKFAARPTSAPHQLDSSQNLLTDFICWRGLLTKLVCTPYENREGWLIGASRFNNTIYLCEFETEQKIQQKADQTERMKEMSYWGYKFEQYITAERPGGKPDTSGVVNNHYAFCSVVRSRLSNHSMAYGGEVDCVDVISKKYIELKTSREIIHPNQDRNFKRFKLIKWWAQSFLVDIPLIVCGFRDDNGIVGKLQKYPTSEIPKICQNVTGSWNANVCFNFLDQFLQYIKDVVTKDDPRVVYLFSWNASEDVRWEEQPVNSSYCFLPEWYTGSSTATTRP